MFAVHAIPGEVPKGAALLVPQFTGFALALVPLYILFRAKYDVSVFEAARLRVSSLEATRSMVHGVGLAFGILALGALLRTPQKSTPLEELMNDPASAPFLAVAAVTIGPFFEELLFRGLLQPLLVRDTGAPAGIVLAALPFALLHGPEYAWSWRHILLIAVAGSAFGWKRLRTRSTGAAVVMHAAYNAVLVIGYLLARKYMNV
jgi:membrane protease YdiL (CAAX protease family)